MNDASFLFLFSGTGSFYVILAVLELAIETKTNRKLPVCAS